MKSITLRVGLLLTCLVSKCCSKAPKDHCLEYSTGVLLDDLTSGNDLDTRGFPDSTERSEIFSLYSGSLHDIILVFGISYQSLENLITINPVMRIWYSKTLEEYFTQAFEKLMIVRNKTVNLLNEVYKRAQSETILEKRTPVGLVIQMWNQSIGRNPLVKDKFKLGTLQQWQRATSLPIYNFVTYLENQIFQKKRISIVIFNKKYHTVTPLKNLEEELVKSCLPKTDRVPSRIQDSNPVTTLKSVCLANTNGHVKSNERSNITKNAELLACNILFLLSDMEPEEDILEETYSKPGMENKTTSGGGIWNVASNSFIIHNLICLSFCVFSSSCL